MNWYYDVERELAHIEGSIRLLEQTRDYFQTKTSINDPAYWRARLHAVRATAEQDRTLLRRADEILALLERF
ncbi:hypothetical protein WR30_16525 [Burkholderia contaminans FFH2055]|uniref:Uncharacterized protein n=1 Tax=Burkholderia contaminans TaxID=488447 RepID=A0A0G3Z4W8_9BURK|nr:MULTISPECIES: hypothetical protein [Burkholderia]AKM44612.1 hypothetical protein NL30_32295 [Burkholderia contaminans]AOL09195.1 hypothetical protein WI95_35005 [Burkholderia contaminans]ELK6461589.1 hypothetical protein [Burkholderia contaminans]KKL35339.1 hypothetical protein WR30_16525 [Burkholderia contaminans FFH2055]KVN63162.1 hypothetical protein WT13_13050 [Burkholderia anthina]